MELKLDSGRKLKIKELTRDDRDGILDSINYDYVEGADGNMKSVGMKATQSTITKWIRSFIVGGDFKKFTKKSDGKPSDSVVDELDMVERSDFFSKLLAHIYQGEETASD